MPSETAKTFINIGNVHLKQGFHIQALDDFSHALEIQRQMLPAHHADIAESQLGRAQAYKKLGFKQEAMVSINEAYNICRKSASLMPSCMTLNVANLLINIGSKYQNQNLYSKSLECYKEALEIQRKWLPALHSDISKTLAVIGSVYRVQGELDKAVNYYKEALHMAKRTLPIEDQYIAATIIGMGTAYKKMDLIDEAEKYLGEAADMCKRHAYNFLLVQALNQYGDVCAIKGLYYEALFSFREALQIEKQAMPLNFAKLASISKKIGVIYARQDHMVEALETCKELLDFQKRAFPPNYSEIAHCLTDIGIIYEKLGQFEQALKFYYDGLEMRRETLHGGHPDIQKSCKLIDSLINREHG